MNKDMMDKIVKEQIEAGATLVVEDVVEYYGHTPASNILLLNDMLTDAEFRVYMAIRSFAYGKKVHCWPGQETIGQLVGKSRQQVNRIIKSLAKKNLIYIYRRGLEQTNIYILRKIPENFIERHQELVEKTDIKKPGKPEKSTDVTFLTHQEVTKMRHHDVPKMLHEEYKSNNSCCCESSQKNKNDQISEVDVETVISAIKTTKNLTVSRKFAAGLLAQYSLQYILNKIYLVVAPMTIKDNYEGTLVSACREDWEPNHKPAESKTTKKKSKTKNTTKKSKQKPVDNELQKLYDALLLS